MSKQIVDGHFTTVEAEQFLIHPEAKVAASQDTSITTAVSANGAAGAITTQDADANAAGATVNTFTVNNSSVLAGSLVFVSIAAYAGTIVTNGIPAVHVSAVANGSFDVTISNSHPANDLAGALTLHYHVM